MDSFDVKILNIVQSDNRLPIEKIANRIGLSPSAVQRRLKRLREDGIIEADVAVISPEAIGRTLTAIVGVIIDKERPLSVALTEFKKLMLSAPEVMQCYDVTGEADFIVIITAKDMQEYEAISRRLFMENPNVRRYKTSLVVRRVKSGTIIPLEPEKP
jgi:Lrp/AsnC family transcriptional regulator, leucine-responsive regulatory protein